MTNKEYLEQYLRIDNKIQSYANELKLTLADKYALQATGYEQSYNASQGTTPSFVNSIERCSQLVSKLEKKIQYLVELKNEIRDVIDEVHDEDAKLVLRCRYIDGARWDEITEIIPCSRSTIRRLHDEAVAKIKIPTKKIEVF